MSSLLARLRAATHHDHHHLDSHPRLRRLLERDLDREGYADALTGLYGAQSSLEVAVHLGLEQLRGLPSDSHGYHLDARTPALRDDLERLGGKRFDEALPPMAVPQRIETLLGLLYVLEGSRLGARVLAKHVHASLGPAVPLRFFAEADGAAHWAGFRAFAERAVRDDALAEPAVQGARAAFALFQHSLDTSPAAMTPHDRLASPLASLEGTS